MSPEAFQKALLRGASASPFKGMVVLIYGTARHECPNTQILSGDNKAKADEFGLNHVRTLKAHVLKSAVPRKPETDKDLIEYKGRKYTIDSVEGDDACSPFWVIDASAPL